MTEKRKRATADELNKVLAAMRAAGAPAPTPLALRTEAGARARG